MKKLTLSIITLLLFLTLGVLSVESASPTPSPTPTPPSEVNSYELFWPIVPGKTRGDSLYSLKTLKEKIRGYIIFGVPQKADYLALLATKRVVEAEKLLKEGKTELAKGSLDDADKLLETIDNSLENNSSFPDSTLSSFNIKMGNMENFLSWLSANHKEAEGELQSLLEKVKTLNSKI